MQIKTFLRTFIASLFAYGILIYVAYLLGKSLQPFVPVGVVLLVLAINAYRHLKHGRDTDSSERHRFCR